MTCAFAPCREVTTCPLVGGCLLPRFGRHATRLVATTNSDVNDKLPALNGILPGRTNRDPRFIKRPRKAIQR